MADLGRITVGCALVLPEPAGRTLGEPLAAVAACAHAAIIFLGGPLGMRRISVLVRLAVVWL